MNEANKIHRILYKSNRKNIHSILVLWRQLFSNTIAGGFFSRIQVSRKKKMCFHSLYGESALHAETYSHYFTHPPLTLHLVFQGYIDVR